MGARGRGQGSGDGVRGHGIVPQVTNQGEGSQVRVMG